MTSSGKLAKVAMALLDPAIPRATVASLAGMKPAAMKEVEARFRRNAHLAFAAPLLDVAFSGLAAPGRELSVAQVGANDGSEGDPVNRLFRRYAGKALLVEPIPELMEPLATTYADFSGDLHIENVAVGPKPGIFELHVLDPAYWNEYRQRVGRHPTAIASFDPGPLARKISVRLEVSIHEARARLKTITCPMVPLHDLLRKHGFEGLDMLQVDCEGFDLEVIRSLADYRPAIIHFESANLPPGGWEEWKAWAAQERYGWIQGPVDTLAIRNAAFQVSF